ncbi:UNVERIFIED_CONTAM: hypothetical protein HDU68_012375 [Siphonaria sp. JEL0065]|nr:hypothetical protein HDU68_012375 [Siphonaria sp. JEL0065]
MFSAMNPPAASALFNDTLVYRGGRILANAEVFVLFYPSSYGPVPFMNETVDFYSSITNSPWWDIMNQYSTPTQKFGAGKFVGSYVESGPTLNYLDDTRDVQPYLRGLVKSGVIKPTANTYIAMHYGPYTRIVMGGQGSCGYWCGYHWSVDISDLVPGLTTLAYGGIPDFFVGGGCDRCVGSDQLGKTLATASHEISEAALDPDYGFGWSEIADVCGGQNARVTAYNGHTFEIQKIFSNSDNACLATAKGTVPPVSTTTTTTTTKKASTSTTTSATTVPKSTITASNQSSTTTTTIKIPVSSVLSTKPTSTTISTTIKATTTGKTGGISNGAACTSFGAWACNNACICNYGNKNTLVWQCTPIAASC